MAEDEYEKCRVKSSANPDCQPKPNRNGPGRGGPTANGATATGFSRQGFSFDPKDIVGPQGSGAALTASVSGPMTFARGIDLNLIRATAGNIGNVSATIAGSAVNDVRAIDSSFITGDLGSIGNIVASAASGAADANLAAIRESDFFARLNIGSVKAIALVTNRSPTAGFARGIEATDSFESHFSTEGSIGKISVSAAGAAQGNVALSGTARHAVSFDAFAGIGAVALTVGKGHATGPINFAATHASFFAGKNIGAFAASGDANAAQVDTVSVFAGGSIASVKVSAKTQSFGGVTNSLFIAGQGRPILVAADLAKAEIAVFAVIGSVQSITIAATGNLDAIRIGGDVQADFFIAGVDVGGDRAFLTGDES